METLEISDKLAKALDDAKIPVFVGRMLVDYHDNKTVFGGIIIDSENRLLEVTKAPIGHNVFFIKKPQTFLLITDFAIRMDDDNSKIIVKDGIFKGSLSGMFSVELFKNGQKIEEVNIYSEHRSAKEYSKIKNQIITQAKKHNVFVKSAKDFEKEER